MKILIPLDGSDYALEAVRHAIRLTADGLRASFVLANVQEPTHFYELMLTDTATVERASLDAGADALQDGEALLSAAGLEFEREVTIGAPANALVDILERYGCDAVVMSARGRGALRSALLGSVSQAVLHGAAVPVTIIKRVEEEPETELDEDVIDDDDDDESPSSREAR